MSHPVPPTRSPLHPIGARLRTAALIVLLTGLAPAGATLARVRTDPLRDGSSLVLASAAAPPSGLVAWWPAHGNGADIVGHHDGDVSTGVRFVDGHVGMAFELSGRGEHVEIPDGSALTPASISIDAWVRTDAIDGDHVIVAKDDPSTAGPSWLLLMHDTGANLQDGRLRFVVHGAGLPGAYRQVETDHRVILPNAWYHVAATFDAATQDMQIYVNGVAITTVLEPGSGTVGSIADGDSPMRIGARADVSGQLVDRWDGRIDEVDLFARALSATEIQAIHAAGADGKLPPETDADGDGVLDARDVCPGTGANTPVDAAGCSVVCAGEPLPEGAPDDAAPDSGAGAGVDAVGGATDAAQSAQSAKRLLASYADLPLFFVENRGQLDDRVAYYVQGRDKTVYFAPDGITFALAGSDTAVGSTAAPACAPAPVRAAAKPPGSLSLASRAEAGVPGWNVKLAFVGADPSVVPVGAEPLHTKVSYFTGAASDRHTGLETYGSIVYRDLWPGIDLIYSGTARRLKYEFQVRAGADPDVIRLRYRGASSVRVDGAGRLAVTTPAGAFRDDRPVAYQVEGAERTPVTASYAVDGGRSATAVTYGFRLGDYDRSRTLIIDPTIFLYSGYIGGANGDYGTAIDVDSAGCAYVAGWTTSSESTFPVVAGPDLTHNGGTDGSGNRLKDAFVAKINAAGTSLVYVGFIGGNFDDRAYGIAVDADGAAYVTGHTASTHATFPVLVGPDLTSLGGDAFVTKISRDGTALLYSGFIGGDGGDGGNAIAIDAQGAAYVAGVTYAASATTFPVRTGPDLSYNKGYTDGFVAKVRPDGTDLEYAGFVGGDGFDEVTGIAVDGCGNAYLSGSTYSLEGTFPDGGGFGPTGVRGSIPGFDTTFNSRGETNPWDAFAVKVRAGGAGLAYASYIGGLGPDRGLGVAVDAAGRAHVIGETPSGADSFPDGDGFGTIPGYDQTLGSVAYPTYGAAPDVFVVRFDPAGTQLEYATYVGGQAFEGASSYSGFTGEGDIALDAAGNAYVTASTGSSVSTGFPATNGPEPRWGGGSDGFVAKLRSDGLDLEYAGYIGGYQPDSGVDIAVDAFGAAYVAGIAHSGEYINPFPVTIGPGRVHGGSADAFVAKIGDPAASTVPPGGGPPLECSPDDDGDGVTDDDDGCFATLPGTPVNAAGCPLDACYPPDAGPTSWWQAEGDALDAVDGNHGQTIGSVTFDTGLVGAAFHLEGSDDVIEIPDSVSLTPGPKGLSIEGWVRPDVPGYILTDGYGCRNYESLYLSTTAFTVNPSSSGGAPKTAQTLSFPALSLHEWSHVAAVWDRDEMTVYVDGVLAASKPASNAPWNPTSPFVIGGMKATLNCFGAGTGYYGGDLAGDVDELAYYRRPLTAPEIRAIYLAGVAGKCRAAAPACAPDGLVSWWPGDGHTRDVLSHHDGLRWNGAKYAPGQAGEAFGLDGSDDYVEIDDQPDQTPSSITIDAWVMPDRLDRGQNIVTKYDTRSSRQLSWALYVQANGHVGMTVYGPEGWTAWRALMSTAPVLTVGRWSHVAGSFDGASQAMAIYVDGDAVPAELVAGSATISAIMDSTAPVRIGASFAATGAVTSPWAGRIDEVGLHDRVLTPAEIEQIYSNGSGGRCGRPNEPPVVDAQGPYAADEGASVLLTGTGEDPEQEPITFTWDLDGDGTFETPGATATFSADGRDGPSQVTVVLRGCDEQDACATDTALVDIPNAPPVPAADVADIDEDGPPTWIDVLVNDFDPGGPADPLVVSGIDTGQTTGLVTFTPAGVVYDPDGRFEALATGETAEDAFRYSVDDDDGGTASADVSVVVRGANDAPTVAADTPGVAVDEGEDAANAGTFADVDVSDSVSVVASIGTVLHDAASAGDWSWSFGATDGPDESATVTITANDGNGGEATTAFELTVANVAPTFEAGDDEDVPTSAAGAFARTVHFGDPGADTHSVSVAWGDGTGDTFAVTPCGRAFALAHTYASSGEFTVAVTVTDDDGGSHGDSFVVTVHLDADGDGVEDAIDGCPDVPGLVGAIHRGCPAAVEVYVQLHIVDQRPGKPACTTLLGNPCKMPIDGAEVRVFDRELLDGLTITVDGTAYLLSANPQRSIYPEVFEQATAARAAECTTHSVLAPLAAGYCATALRAPDDFLVLVKYVDEAGGQTRSTYTGNVLDADRFVDSNADGVADLAEARLQFIKMYRKDGSVQFNGGAKTVITGSYLEIVAPDYADWGEGASAYGYPFIFASDSAWEVDVCASVPQGYDIVGVYDENGDLVATAACHQTIVAGETKVIVFEVADLQSPKPNVKTKLTIKHKGKTHKIELETPGHRRGRDRRAGAVSGGPRGSQAPPIGLPPGAGVLRGSSVFQRPARDTM